MITEGFAQDLKKDLSGFADPDPDDPPVVELDGRTLQAIWRERGEERRELFQIDGENQPLWLQDGDEARPYGEFLTSQSMADFEQLARAISRSTRRVDHFVPSDAAVEGPGFLEYHELTAEPDHVLNFIDNKQGKLEGRTDLYFLKGAPGAGKTTLLKEICSTQATRYLEGESEYLFFYVSAQGRELGNLMDAFAGELQDLRARFTRDAIPVLTRTGRLIPIVDGFDELLGTAGYSGAFSSLQSLLSDLDGLGALLVSARSSFYDYEFLNRASTPTESADIRVTTLDLAPWTEEQLLKYLRAVAGEEIDLRQMSESDRRVLQRPFFASQYPGLASDYLSEGADGDFYGHLMSAYMEREASKIQDSNGDPVLPVAGHEQFLAELASEMWESESRVLQLDDVRVIAELIAEEHDLSDDSAKQFNAKLTSYAGLASGRTPGEVVFEHEVYFDHFLGQHLASLLNEGSAGQGELSELHVALNRGVVPGTVIENLRGKVRWERGALGLISQAPSSLRLENRRRNQGALVGAAIRELEILQDQVFEGLQFIDSTLGQGTFRQCTFRNCVFNGTDLQGTRFEGCSVEGGQLNALVVDNSSWLDASGLVPGINVGSIKHTAVVVHSGEAYAVTDVKAILEKLGTQFDEEAENQLKLSERGEYLASLLNLMARAYRRTNILFEADETLQKLFSDKEWPSLRKVIIESGVVSEEMKPSSGRSSRAFRLRVPAQELMSGRGAGSGSTEASIVLWRLMSEQV